MDTNDDSVWSDFAKSVTVRPRADVRVSDFPQMTACNAYFGLGVMQSCISAALDDHMRDHREFTQAMAKAIRMFLFSSYEADPDTRKLRDAHPGMELVGRFALPDETKCVAVIDKGRQYFLLFLASEEYRPTSAQKFSRQ